MAKKTVLSKIWRWLVVLVIVLLAGQPSPALVSAAGPWYVAPGGSDGNTCSSPASPCATINAAIGKAASYDTIYVAMGTYTSSSGYQVVLIDKSLTLSGGWDAVFTVQGGSSTIDGQGARRGITVNAGLTAFLERFTVQNGNTPIFGGGISNSGTLNLNQIMIKDNFSGYWGGGIHTAGSLTVSNSTIQNNRAVLGGGILGTPLYLNNSTVTGNSAVYGGGISQVGVGTITSINSSTIRGNTAVEDGGGLQANNGNITIRNSLVDDNFAANSGPDCSGIGPGAITSAGHSLISDTSGCPYVSGVGDLTNVPAILGTLVGYPPFHPLLAGSPAIDTGNPAGCTDGLGVPLLTDQRGAGRTLDGDGDNNARCDIGAFEYNPDETPFSFVHLPLVSGRTCPGAYRDTFGDPTSGWPVDIQPDYTLEYLHTEYHMLLWDTQSWLGAAPGITASEFSLSVDLRTYSGTWGLLFGISDDWSQFYSFEVYNGEFFIYRYNSGIWTLLAQGPAVLNHGWGIQQLKIERQGDQIRAYTSGQLVATVTDNTYTGPRRVGLIIVTRDSPGVDVRFDNFVLTPLSCAGSAAVDIPNHDPVSAQVPAARFFSGRR